LVHWFLSCGAARLVPFMLCERWWSMLSGTFMSLEEPSWAIRIQPSCWHSTTLATSRVPRSTNVPPSAATAPQYMSQPVLLRLASCKKLAHTHTNIWLLLLSHWMASVSRVYVDLSLSCWVREQADTRWMIGTTTREREREIISGNITLSLELWEQKGGGQHYPLEIDVRVCASIQIIERERERLMLIVLCFWLSLQLLHVDLIIIIKQTLFFQHTNNKLIVKHNIINFNIHLLACTTNTTQTK